jgi:hypothetical protein
MLVEGLSLAIRHIIWRRGHPGRWRRSKREGVVVVSMVRMTKYGDAPCG